jgi:hypothetical protein
MASRNLPVPLAWYEASDPTAEMKLIMMRHAMRAWLVDANSMKMEIYMSMAKMSRMPPVTMTMFRSWFRHCVQPEPCFT